MRLSDSILINQVILERRRSQVQKFLTGHSLKNLTVEETKDIILDELIVKLKTEILAEVEPKELYIAVFKIHSSWYQWFKDDCLPRWFKKFYPVKYIFVKKYLTVHREAWYPQLNRIFPECGQIIIKDVWEEKEIRNY